MKKLIKNAILAIIICSIIATSPVYGENANGFETIYSLTDKTIITNSITHETIRMLTSSGWMNINVVRANLKDENTYTKPLYNTEGISTRAPLSTLMKQSNAISGINGDFYNMGYPNQCFGPIITDNKIITSPLGSNYKYPTISLDNNGKFDISIWNSVINIHSEKTNSTVPVHFINKAAYTPHATVILDSSYGEKSIGNTFSETVNGAKKYRSAVEVVVVDNIVKEIRDGLEPVEIPKNGYIISSSNDVFKKNIKNTYSIGEKLSIEINLEFDINNIQWAVGGVNYLVKDGKLNIIEPSIGNRHPRSAVGFSKDGSEIIFVTLDGRNKNFVGATQEELAKIMIDLGAYNAVNMDGGGSTTMGVDFLKNGNVEIVNIPSDGRERYITSGLGIFSNAPETDVLEYIEIVPQYDKVFKDNKVSLSVKGYNKHMSEIDITDKKVTFSINSTDGSIDKNILTPSKVGEIVITAKVDNIETSYTLKVLDKPEALIFEDNTLTMQAGETYEFGTILGVDKNGETAFISVDKLSWGYRNSVGKVVDGVFTASNTNNVGAITATYGNAVKHIIVNVGYMPRTIFSFEKNDMSNINYSSYPSTSNGKIEFTDTVTKEKYGAIKLSYDFSNMTDQSIAFVNFGKNSEGLKVEGMPKAIGMWVFGDNSTHWLRTRVQDATGKVYKIDFAEEVNWKDWKWVVATLPEDIVYPVKVNNVYLAEINEQKKDSGAIYIDSLRALYPIKKDLKLREESTIKDSLNASTVTNYTQKINIKNNTITHEIKDNQELQAKTINVNIKNGSLGIDINFWNSLKSLTSLENANVILSLNNDLGKIIDEREEEVFDAIVKEIAQKNTVFITFPSVKKSISIIDGVRYIAYEDEFNFFITSNGVKYVN